MTERSIRTMPRTRRSVVKSGLVLAGGVAAIGAGTRAFAQGTPGSTPAASPAVVGGSLTIYSGRNEELIAPAVEVVAGLTGISAEVRYGSTAEMAATLSEEGENTPATLYIAQDAGALGQLANEGLLAALPASTLDQVDPRFSSPDGLWVGVSGRARVLVYNTDLVEVEALPTSVLDLTGEDWNAMVGWAPENASFQAFVTALRVLRGDDAAREWLQAMVANGAQVYEGNGQILTAVAAGEIATGLVNHYYKFQIEAEEGELPIENHYFAADDPGSLINVAGVAVTANGPDQEQAQAFAAAFLTPEVQTYFAETTFEYPMVEGISASNELLPLAEVGTPEIDLSDLADLEGTLELLAEVGVL